MQCTRSLATISILLIGLFYVYLDLQQLTALYHLEHLAGHTHINLSSNQLSNLGDCHMLQCVEKLSLNSNGILWKCKLYICLNSLLMVFVIKLFQNGQKAIQLTVIYPTHFEDAYAGFRLTCRSPLCRVIITCCFRVAALSGNAALALSPSGIAPKLNRIQLSAICRGGQSGKVID